MLTAMHLDPSSVASALKPFGIDLDHGQSQQVVRYVDLLIRWNRAVNLTAIENPKEILARHFGESMVLAKLVDLRGSLLDVGTGAGFPGLALKIIRPELNVVLLEPVTKKRAFLKEVLRECGLTGVEVRGDRIEDFSEKRPASFDFVTVRAVGSFGALLPAIASCLTPQGSICLWLTGSEALDLREREPLFDRLFKWANPAPVPKSRDREIWVGKAN